jgi:hypothetical protein
MAAPLQYINGNFVLDPFDTIRGLMAARDDLVRLRKARTDLQQTLRHTSELINESHILMTQSAALAVNDNLAHSRTSI